MRVAFLWHMHQPSYWEADLERYRYPWVFLHASRHYHMMGAVAREHPEMAMTINVTPVLLEQLVDYSRGGFKDKILDVVRKPADSLDAADVELLLDHAFKLPVPTMIAPFPRYRELRSILEKTRPKKVRRDELRDLQVWYLLTWTGMPSRKRPEIAGLLRKGKGFTEKEKALVFEACQQAVGEVLPLYRELQERGAVEIATTPYYHPILPLVIDCGSARESKENVQLDGISFRFPQDARWHVEEAAAAYRELFGRPPRGMWPAEGSVSDAALELLASCGLRWAATDEAILSRSLGRFPLSEAERHTPHAFRATGLRVYFRDRELSDRIGFIYSSWDPRSAAGDVVERLLGIRKRLGRREAAACVSIILDGENPWEYYPGGGEVFLSELFRLLTTTPGLETVRMGDPDVPVRDSPPLQHVVPGSWIDANFDTWIGAPEKNRAWIMLSVARQKLALSAPEKPVPREFYRAEGSDWFWWLGPGHDTPYEASYENLFRTNLLEGLAQVGIEAPPQLEAAPYFVSSPRYESPLHLFTPRIEGRLGNYYDWVASGLYLASEGSIHRAERVLERVRFGFDSRCFYVRAEGRLRTLAGRGGEVSLVVEFLRPRDIEVLCSAAAVRFRKRNGESGSDSRGDPCASGGKAAIGAVAEAGLPLEELLAQSGDLIDFAVGIRVGENHVDRIPQSGYITVEVPSPDFGSENWSV